MKVYLHLKIEPKPLARARSTYGHHYYTSSAQNEMDELKWAIYEAMGEANIKHTEINKLGRESLKMSVSMEFGISLPQSYSKKKRGVLLGTPHTQKPDLDNLIKNVLDRGNEVLWQDDKYIHSIRASKTWAEQGYIKIEVDYE